jgi:hypothetical protein
VGPAADAARIPGIDVQLKDGDVWRFGSQEARVFDVPGHTRGHIAFHFPAASTLFPGDTLFALGCGRLFEGTPAQRWASLSKLAALPRDTAVCCAHEYTQANARFALTIDGGNASLRARAARIDEMRARVRARAPPIRATALPPRRHLCTAHRRRRTAAVRAAQCSSPAAPLNVRPCTPAQTKTTSRASRRCPPRWGRSWTRTPSSGRATPRSARPSTPRRAQATRRSSPPCGPPKTGFSARPPPPRVCSPFAPARAHAAHVPSPVRPSRARARWRPTDRPVPSIRRCRPPRLRQNDRFGGIGAYWNIAKYLYTYGKARLAAAWRRALA